MHSDAEIRLSKPNRSSGDLRCDVCLTSPGGPVPVCPVGVETVAGGRYAVFVHTGPYTGVGGVYHKFSASSCSEAAANTEVCPDWKPVRMQ